MGVNGARLNAGDSAARLLVTVELPTLTECCVERSVLITGRQRSRGETLHCHNEVSLADLRKVLIALCVVE